MTEPPRTNPADGLKDIMGKLLDKISPEQMAAVASFAGELKSAKADIAVLKADITQIGANLTVLDRKLDELLRRTAKK